LNGEVQLGKYPYINNTGKLRKFLEGIPKIKVPDKINYKYLSSIGFKSTFDRPIVSILQFIGFINTMKVPTKKYRAFKVESKSKATMASALKSAYSELFDIYENAHEVDAKSLKDFFTQYTDAGEQVISRTVDTFSILCTFADFKAELVEDEEKGIEEGDGEKEGGEIPSMPTGVTVNVNIQLTLPATEDATVYDKIFRALKENLLS
jgi:hypothetical protein